MGRDAGVGRESVAKSYSVGDQSKAETRQFIFKGIFLGPVRVAGENMQEEAARLWPVPTMRSLLVVAVVTASALVRLIASAIVSQFVIWLLGILGIPFGSWQARLGVFGGFLGLLLALDLLRLRLGQPERGQTVSPTVTEQDRHLRHRAAQELRTTAQRLRVAGAKARERVQPQDLRRLEECTRSAYSLADRIEGAEQATGIQSSAKSGGVDLSERLITFEQQTLSLAAAADDLANTLNTQAAESTDVFESPLRQLESRLSELETHFSKRRWVLRGHG